MSLTTPAPSHGRIQAVVGAAIVVILVASALTALGAVKYFRDSGSGTPAVGTPAASAAAAAVAVTEGGQLAVDFTTYNYKTIDADFVNTSKHATAAFAKVYLAQSRLFEASFKKVKSVAVGQIVATALQSFDSAKGTADVLVALNVVTTNTKAPDGTPQYYRMQIQMVHQNGQWLATGVNPQ